MSRYDELRAGGVTPLGDGTVWDKQHGGYWNDQGQHWTATYGWQHPEAPTTTPAPKKQTQGFQYDTSGPPIAAPPGDVNGQIQQGPPASYTGRPTGSPALVSAPPSLNYTPGGPDDPAYTKTNPRTPGGVGYPNVPVTLPGPSADYEIETEYDNNPQAHLPGETRQEGIARFKAIAKEANRSRVPPPHQINVAVWDRLGPVGQQLALGAAAAAGWDKDEYLNQINQARPQGHVPGNTQVDYAAPRGIYS